MLKPPGNDFTKAAVASTLCPACARRIEHRPNHSIAAVRTTTPDGAVMKLVANQMLVIHSCSIRQDDGSGAPGASDAVAHDAPEPAALDRD